MTEKRLNSLVETIVLFILIIVILYFVFVPKISSGYYLIYDSGSPAIMLRMQNGLDVLSYKSIDKNEVMDEWQKIINRHETVMDYDRKEE